MHLAKVAISNFKALKTAELGLTSFDCLVGENNAGKSSVLQAIVYALNRPPNLSESLFYDTSLPITLALTFTEISVGDIARLADEHRSKIEPLILNGCLSLIVRYKVSERGAAITVLKRIPIEPRYRAEAIELTFKGKRGAALKAALLETFPEFSDDVPEELSITTAKAYVAERINRLPPEGFDLEEGPLPSGISSSIAPFLPEPIYIPAVKNLADELKTTQSTSFGRLLGLLLEDMTPDLALVTSALATLNQLLNKSVNGEQPTDLRHTRVKELEASVEGFLKQNFPGAKIELRIPPPELRAILNAAEIYVDDGSRDLIENKGDGIKRSLTFALLQAYVDYHGRRSAAPEQSIAPRPLLFLFEEPELYLHPKSQRVLFDTLGRIATDHQVVVTTHSPFFFAPGVTAGFIRVSKQQAFPKPVTALHCVNFALDTNTADVFRLARFENADAAFFSSRIVLIEGESDDAYFRHIAKMLNPNWDFDKKNVAFVKVSGKGNFSRFRKFFEAFGIDVKIVADLDALFEGYSHLGASSDLAAIRSTAIQTIDERRALEGILAEPSARQIKRQVGQESWRTRWASAKQGLAAIKRNLEASAEVVQAIEQLFQWEDDIGRVRACREDYLSRRALVPLLDRLRAEGICVLSRGALEDYYPQGISTQDGKPDQALAAIKMVTTLEVATGLSDHLLDLRKPELVEIVDELFRGL